MQDQAGKMSQLEQRHQNVDGGERRAERLQLYDLLQPREELLIVGRTVTHPAEREHQLLDHLRTHKHTCRVLRIYTEDQMTTCPILTLLSRYSAFFTRKSAMVSSSRVSLSRWRAMYLAIRAIVYGVMLSAFFGSSSV